MKEGMKFSSALALVTALFVTLAIVQATKTQARTTVTLQPAGSAATDYASKCASCHGRDGRGKTTRGRLSHARNLTDAGWQSNVTDERLFNSISNGKGKMPSFKKKLSEDQIDALVRYVRQLKK